MNKYIYVKNKRYYYFDTYSTYRQALSVAKKQYKRNRSKYFILICEKGWLYPYKVYKLYLTNVIKLF